jgi:hypothetical protein
MVNRKSQMVNKESQMQSGISSVCFNFPTTQLSIFAFQFPFELYSNFFLEV